MREKDAKALAELLLELLNLVGTVFAALVAYLLLVSAWDATALGPREWWEQAGAILLACRLSGNTYHTVRAALRADRRDR